MQLLDIDSTSASATFAGISALASIVTAAIAAWSLFGSRRDSRDRTRPVITATFEPGTSNFSGNTFLVVRNRGQSVAREVRVTFHPPISAFEPPTDGGESIIAGLIGPRYSQPITVIGPGQQFSNIYTYVDNGNPQTVEPVPDQLTVNVKYKDDHGRSYKDEFPLDTNAIGMESVVSKGAKNEPTLRMNEALEAIAWEQWKNRQG